jgi:hypothetical protein
MNTGSGNYITFAIINFTMSGKAVNNTIRRIRSWIGEGCCWKGTVISLFKIYYKESVSV